MLDLGVVRPGSTIRIPFSTFDKDDGSAITMTNFAAADILIYKDGGTTERASTAGFTATTDFDAKTGKHVAVIDLADNTTAGYYNAGSEYLVAIDAVTVDGVTVGAWIARFRIGYPNANLDTTIATLSSQTSFTLTAGPAEDNALVGHWAIIHDIASAVQRSTVLITGYTGSTKTVTLAAGATFTVAAGDNISVIDLAPLQPATLGRTLLVGTSGQASADVTHIAGSSITADGPVPHLGILDQGTAQSASSTGLVLRAAAAFGDDTPVGCILAAFGSTQGYWQFREITDFVGATDTATVDAWTVTPSGTITYRIFAGVPAPSTPPAVNVTHFGGVAGTFASGFPQVRNAVVQQVTDKLHSMLEAAPGSPGESRFTTDSLVNAPNGTMTASGIRSAIGLAAANLDAQIATLATATTLARVREVTDQLATMLTAASGSPGEFKFTADAVQAVQTVLGSGGANLDAQLSAILTAIGTRLATASYTAPNNAGIASIKEITDRFYAMLEPAGNSPGEFRFSADALARVQTVLGVAAGNIDLQLAAIFARAVATEVDTQDIQSRLPAALVGGRIDASIGAAQANTITAAAVAADAVAEIQSGLASSTQAAAIQIVTDRLATMLTAASGSPGEFKFTADALQAVQTVLGFAAGNFDTQLLALFAALDALPTAAENADAVWDEATAGHVAAGTFGERSAQIRQVTDKLHSMLEAAPGSPGESRFTADALVRAPSGTGGGGGGLSQSDVRDAVGLASANLDVQLAALAGYIDTEVAAIKQVTDRLATMITAAAGSPGEFKFTADAIQAVQAALGVSAANLDTQLAAISAAVATRLAAAAYTAPDNATITAIAGYVDTEIAAIKQVTDKLHSMVEAAASSPGEFRFTADAVQRVQIVLGVAAANLDAQLAALVAYVDNEVAAIKQVTDQLATMVQVAPGSPNEYRFTGDALELAPAGGGGGGGTDWTVGEREQIRHRLGIDGSAAAPGATPSLAAAAELAAVKVVADALGTTLEPSAGSPGEYRFTDEAVAKTADAVLNAQRADFRTGGTVGEAVYDSDIRGRRTVIRGTVGSGSSPTSIVTSAFDPAGADANQFQGRIVVFDKDTATAALRGQATDITASSASATPTLTVTALTATPAAGDTFSVL